MRKIYFTKQEVKIGDSFLYKDVRLIVTDELVQDNPHLFSVEGSAEQDYVEPEILKLDLDTSWKSKKILNLGISSRAKNCLSAAKVLTLEDLSNIDFYRIRTIKNVGKETYKDIINLINREIPKQFHKK